MRGSGDSRRWQFLSFVVATLVGRPCALAEEPPRPQVLVVCEELSQEARAAIEVRHLGDMADLSAPIGTLRLTCQTDAVVGEWVEGGVPAQRRSVSRAPNDSPTELLHWIASLLIDGRRQSELQHTSVSTGNFQAQDEGGTVVREIPGLAPSSPEPKSAEIAPNTERGDAEMVGGASHPGVLSETSVDVPASRVEPATSGEATSPWGGSLGVRYQHWGKEIPGALGPLARVEHSFARDWSAVVALSWLWGVRSSGRLGASEGSASAGVDYDIFDEWSAGMAVVLTMLTLTTDAPNATRVFEVLPALDVTTRARFPAPGWGAFAEAGLRAVPVSREVRLDGTAALHIPEVRALVSIGATFTQP